MTNQEKTKRENKVEQILITDYQVACSEGNMPGIPNETSDEMMKLAHNDKLTPDQFDTEIAKYEYYA